MYTHKIKTANNLQVLLGRQRSWFKDSLGKDLVRPHLNNKKNWAHWHTPVIPAMQEALTGGWQSRPVSLGKIVRPYLKNSQSRKD
jgi:hypothetical protein